ncbi:C40 family peptidase [Tsukamurella soli]|uniref:NlpC/P60 domain-containing protein n=1 Tax=Tsukamurella soli TaxID=644556 RepID=A0ABP8JBZ2_9ACTN
MAKHRLQTQPSRGATAARGALAAGAVTIGSLAAPAAIAAAAPAPGPHTQELSAQQIAKKKIKHVKDVKAVKRVVKKRKPLAERAVITPRAVTVTAGSVQARAVQAALSRLGAPYSYGAAGPNAFDCSGLVQWSMKQAGIRVPRDSWGQLGGGRPVALNELQPGDIIIYNGGSHAALYIGGGKVVQSMTYGVPVKVTPLDAMRVYAARRY